MTDKYEPICLIGKGNFGSISKIRRKSDGMILVWKELNYGTMKDKYKHHIISEINILKELNHQNIVKYYDHIIDKEKTKIYIIMEYCPGGDLSQLIKRSRHSKQYIKEDIIWKIFSQVVSALYACHMNKSGKILHRDIKPSNVFIDNNNVVKLGDFGLSLQLNKEINFAYSNVGTPYYMSPEQVDENKYNEKSDIWSLGCFLYELASLHPPFEAHNHLSLALKIKSGKVEKLPEIYSENLEKTILWMLNINQEKRPNIKDIIKIPEVSIRIKEKKIKDGYLKLKKYENDLKLREDNLLEQEKTLKLREQYLNEREKNLIKRENFIKMKENEIEYKDNNIFRKYKHEKNIFKNNDLFITSGGFDIQRANNYKENNKCINNKTIKNNTINNNKNYIISKNELTPVNYDKKYSNTIRRTLNNEKFRFNNENSKNINNDNTSFYSHKFKTNMDLNLNNNINTYKNILTNNYKTSKHTHINSINFNNSNNSLSKINSAKNIGENHSRVISFNSELNYSSNDEKIIKSNTNINTSNLNSLGFFSINSQENNTMAFNNSINNINNSIRNNSLYHNRHSNSNNALKENHKDSNNEINQDYKSGSTNYFSSIPHTLGDSYENPNNFSGDKDFKSKLNKEYYKFDSERNYDGQYNKFTENTFGNNNSFGKKKDNTEESKKNYKIRIDGVIKKNNNNIQNNNIKKTNYNIKISREPEEYRINNDTNYAGNIKKNLDEKYYKNEYNRDNGYYRVKNNIRNINYSNNAKNNSNKNRNYNEITIDPNIRRIEFNSYRYKSTNYNKDNNIYSF